MLLRDAPPYLASLVRSSSVQQQEARATQHGSMGFGEQWAEAKAVKNAVLGDKEYRGPRGNISQGGGAFLNHPENKVSERAKRIPGYQGHRPYANVVSAPLQVTPRMMAARGSSGGGREEMDEEENYGRQSRGVSEED